MALSRGEGREGAARASSIQMLYTYIYILQDCTYIYTHIYTSIFIYIYIYIYTRRIPSGIRRPCSPRLSRCKAGGDVRSESEAQTHSQRQGMQSDLTPLTVQWVHAARGLSARCGFSDLSLCFRTICTATDFSGVFNFCAPSNCFFLASFCSDRAHCRTVQLAARSSSSRTCQSPLFHPSPSRRRT